jgi:hypothetical protein
MPIFIVACDLFGQKIYNKEFCYYSNFDLVRMNISNLENDRSMKTELYNRNCLTYKNQIRNLMLSITLLPL